MLYAWPKMEEDQKIQQKLWVQLPPMLALADGISNLQVVLKYSAFTNAANKIANLGLNARREMKELRGIASSVGNIAKSTLSEFQQAAGQAQFGVSAVDGSTDAEKGILATWNNKVVE